MQWKILIIMGIVDISVWLWLKHDAKKSSMRLFFYTQNRKEQ